MNSVDKMLARAQVGLAFMFATGFLGILVALLLVPGITKEASGLLANMLAVLGTLLTLQMNYFFSRQRAPALPEPPPLPNGDPNAQIPTPTAPVLSPAPTPTGNPFRT